MQINRQAFTLIELLVVVLMVGILAAVALPQYQKAVLKSRYIQNMIFLRTAYQAWKSFYLANGFYTTSWDKLDIDLPGTVAGNTLYNGSYKCNIYINDTGFEDSMMCRYHTSAGDLIYRIYPSGSTACMTTDWKAAKDVCLGMGGILRSESGGYFVYTLTSL